MAGRKSNPLKVNGSQQWDREQVMAIVMPRLSSMPMTEALALGFQDADGNQHGLPCVSTINEWLVDNPQWAAGRAQAQQSRAEILANEALKLVDEEPPKLQNGAIDGGHVRWAEARAKQRQWLAAKLDRRTYGEQMQVDMNVHASIDIAGVLAEARGRVIEGRAERVADSLPPGAEDLFE